MLYHDRPASAGVENALKRAKQIVRARYAPIRPLPLVCKLVREDGGKAYGESELSPGYPAEGMVYSSVRRVEKYVGYNISPETFYTALQDPLSVLYTRRIAGTGQNVHAFYGIVCSAFVSWVLELPYRTPCKYLPRIEGMRLLTEFEDEDSRNCGAAQGDLLEGYRLEALQLLDVILDTTQHVAIITDIERDVNGRVRFVTVSESVLPFARETRFTPEQFVLFWMKRGFRVYRYAHTDGISYTPSPYVPLPEDAEESCALPRMPGSLRGSDGTAGNPLLMPNFGNNANYRLADEPVVLDVLSPAVERVLIVGEDGTEELLPAGAVGTVRFDAKRAGFYRAFGICGEERTEPVGFCVTDLSFRLEKTALRPGETVNIRYQNASGDPLVAWQFNLCATDRGTGGGFFAPALPPDGEIRLEIPKVHEPVELYLIAKNRFGYYTSARTRIDPAAAE